MLRESGQQIAYAHSYGSNSADWELLRDHLIAVAEAAGQRSEKFSCGHLGHAAGLLHDLGKYDPLFQRRLRDDSVRVDHAAPGAAAAIDRYGPKLGTLLAHIVAGHHTGLRDGVRDDDTNKTTLEERLSREARGPMALAGAGADGIELADKIVPDRTIDPGSKDTQGFTLAFLIRMLFSCLVDADYVETERFYAVREGVPVPRGDDTDLRKIRASLDTHLATKMAEAARAHPGSVNTARAEILSSVRAKADLPQGLFTLTVPTGGGKTLASLAFALDHAIRYGLDRVIVVIPFTSVIEQTASVYREALAPFDGSVLEHHSAFDTTTLDRRPLSDIEETMKWEGQGKLRRAMENWDARIVVTTAVQFFESLFADRTSRCRKLHNIAKSVVVIDEAQTLPLPLLRPAVLALSELARNYRTTVVLSTATQPALDETQDPMRSFAGGLRNVKELAPDPVRLFEVLRRVRVEHAGRLADHDVASRLAESDQVLCIVNTRRHARALYEQIGALPGAHHLSTFMCAAHRTKVLDGVRTDLREGRPCRVVSTSLVEAGVDVDFPLVLRAEAGLDQIAQAAGRCNREGRRSVAVSCVVVFEVEAKNRLKALAAQGDAARAVMRWVADSRLTPDLLAPEAISAYFRELYTNKGAAALDEMRILERLEDRRGDLNFPFETVASLFRLIDDAMVPVIVPYEPRKDAIAGLCERLLFTESVGGIARKLQRFLVNVPPRDRQALIARGAARVIASERLGDQFVLLTDTALYRKTVGLDLSDPTFMETSAQVV